MAFKLRIRCSCTTSDWLGNIVLETMVSYQSFSLPRKQKCFPTILVCFVGFARATSPRNVVFSIRHVPMYQDSCKPQQYFKILLSKCFFQKCLC